MVKKVIRVGARKRLLILGRILGPILGRILGQILGRILCQILGRIWSPPSRLGARKRLTPARSSEAINSWVGRFSPPDPPFPDPLRQPSPGPPGLSRPVPPPLPFPTLPAAPPRPLLGRVLGRIRGRIRARIVPRILGGILGRSFFFSYGFQVSKKG